MIVIKIELHSAITGKVTPLGQMHIANDGTGTNAKCNYIGRVFRKPLFKDVTRHGYVAGHRRLDKTIWHLAGSMLKAMGYVS